ncbi:MAG: hypothetical protein GKS03_15600 [Alphaproteobacteria bacterium]|nr:hypothetical protein [Alphaproteobacteria bacterium]
MPLNVYYDTRLAPVTFDFANFLINAEAARQFTSFTSIYLNVIAPDFRRMSQRDHEYESSEKRWRVQHILGQIPKLLPTVIRTNIQYDPPSQVVAPNYPPGYPDIGKKYLNFYSPRLMLGLYEQGAKVQLFQSSAHAKNLVRTYTRGHSYVTISLRTSQFQTARNSNLDAWYRFSKVLEENGKRVLVLPDFEDCFNERAAWKYDWNVVDFAAHDLDLRLALYEDADDNFIVNNGVVTVLFYSKCPFKMFNVNFSDIQTTSNKFINLNWMVDPDETPKIFQDNQKWIWLNDDFDNLMAHID